MRTRRQDRIEASEAASTASRSPDPESDQPSSPSSGRVVSIRKSETTSQPVGAVGVASRRESRLPAPVRFPLVVVLNLAVAALGYSLSYPYTKAVLAVHARSLDTWGEYGALVGWRVFELALGWFGNYDSYDLAALNLLSHGPPLYLLAAFYNTPPSALALTLAIETFATYLPFRLLRPLSTAHADPASTSSPELLTDRQISLLTSLLAAAIYSVTLFASYATFLPNALIVYFDGLPSLAAAHENGYVQVLPVTLVLGFAATAFIFTPAVAEPRDVPGRPFDPASASLKETVSWNLWGWSRRTKIIVQRTAALVLVTGVNTTLQTALTVAGAETRGALAWASVWVVAAAFTGLGLGVVGSE